MFEERRDDKGWFIGHIGYYNGSILIFYLSIFHGKENIDKIEHLFYS